MRFRIASLTLLALCASVSFGLGQEHEGKELFIKEKCNTCHTVKSQNIEATRGNDESPDFSNASELIPDAAWAKKFVLREETKDGKKHRRPFKGDEKDLEKIVAWLMTLKSS